MKSILRTILIVLCVASAAQAQTSQQRNPVVAFHNAVMGDATLLGVYLMTPNDPQQVPTAKKGQSDLKALVGPALDAAAGNADLKAAIKAFYIAADGYFQSVFTLTGLPDYVPGIGTVPSSQQVQLSATQARLRADLDAKNSALELEMDLASK